MQTAELDLPASRSLCQIGDGGNLLAGESARSQFSLVQSEKALRADTPAGGLLEPSENRRSSLAAQLLERDGFRERLEGSLTCHQLIRTDSGNDLGQDRVCTFQVQECNFH